MKVAIQKRYLYSRKEHKRHPNSTDSFKEQDKKSAPKMAEESQEPWTPPYKKLLIDGKGQDKKGKSPISSAPPSMEGVFQSIVMRICSKRP